MICGKCGHTIEDGALFCPVCGGKVNSMASIAEKPLAQDIEPDEQTIEPTVQSSEPVQQASKPAAQVQATPVQIAPEEPKQKEFFGVGAFVACLAVIAVLAATSGTFAFLYFSAIGAI